MGEKRAPQAQAAVLGLALVGWTALFGMFANFGRFAVSDTSCDGGDLRPSPFGIVYLIVGAAVWTVPFMMLAIKTRSVATIVLLLVAVIVATVVATTIATDPGEHCF